MIPRRRFVVQLTPLLDLLIILVFALLLGLRQQGRTEEDRARSVVTEAVPELSGEADPVAALVRQHRRDAKSLDRARDQNARLASEHGNREQLADELDRSRKQQDGIGDLVAELLQVPDETLKQARTSAEFDDRLFRAYKSLDQPKDLVIVMLSWRADARFAAIETAVSRLPSIAERMRNDRSGQTQFQFLVLSLQHPSTQP